MTEFFTSCALAKPRISVRKSSRRSDQRNPPLATAAPGTSIDQAKSILNERKVEKLLLVDGDFNLKGLVTMKDINKTAQHPHAAKDDKGKKADWLYPWACGNCTAAKFGQPGAIAAAQ